MSSLQSKWLAFLDDHLLDDPAQPNAFFWCGLNEQGDLSANDSWCEKDRGGKEKACTRKRLRDEPCSGTATKACREKMRRDRLNERFLELSTILESGKAPKTDKVVVLGDALHALNQLKAEAQQLRDSNEKLQEAIKKLRVEKSELREERVKLKAQKDQLEQQLKAVAMPATACYLPHPAALHAAMAAFAARNQVAGTKGAVPGYPGMGMGMGMWQWMTPAALDTSQDHMLRPPVA